jgi:hypothetical protein
MVLAELHDRAPVHAWPASARAIEAAFGRPAEELFDRIDTAALASGSIAQARALGSACCPPPGANFPALLHLGIVGCMSPMHSRACLRYMPLAHQLRPEHCQWQQSC